MFSMLKVIINFSSSHKSRNIRTRKEVDVNKSIKRLKETLLVLKIKHASHYYLTLFFLLENMKKI